MSSQEKKISTFLETERRGPIKRQNIRETIYRILSYSTLVTPLILGLGKLIHRFRNRFVRFQASHILFSFQKTKKETLQKKNSLIQEAKEKTTIENGYGEYIAYQLLPSGEKIIPSDSLFRQVKSILQLFNQSEQRPSGGNLFPLLKEQLQQIDPSLSIAFVPKSLYNYIERQEQSRSADNLDTRVHTLFLQYLNHATFSYEDLKKIIQKETPSLPSHCQQRLLEATALESTSFAASHRFIYRTHGQLSKDRPYFLGRVRSLAYTNFLSFDANKQGKGYFIPVAYRDLAESPFFFSLSTPPSSLPVSGTSPMPKPS